MKEGKNRIGGYGRDVCAWSYWKSEGERGSTYNTFGSEKEASRIVKSGIKSSAGICPGRRTGIYVQLGRDGRKVDAKQVVQRGYAPKVSGQGVPTR